MSLNKPTNDNLDVLGDIYNPRTEIEVPRKSLTQSVEQYFKNFGNDSKKVNRVLASAIVLLALGTLFYGYSGVTSSLNLLPEEGETDVRQDLAYESGQPDLLGLRQKDTDGDGLSDYDEVNIHFTSAYLDDSDSDGVSDRDEIANSTNPNCPHERNCSVFDAKTEFDLAAAAVAVEERYPEDTLKQVFGDYLNGKQIDSTLLTEEINALSTAQIRELLEQQGFSRDILDNISDGDLMSLVEETLATY